MKEGRGGKAKKGKVTKQEDKSALIKKPFHAHKDKKLSGHSRSGVIKGGGSTVKRKRL